MFGGGKAAERRREAIRLADQAADYALEAIAQGDLKRARNELAAAPKRISYADGGWKPALAAAVLDLMTGKRRQGLAGLVEFCTGLDETSLSRDDKGYLRLYALYRAIDASRDGRAPAELRDLVEDFRFDHTLVSRKLKARFPLKKIEESTPPPPPMARPVQGEEF